MRPSEIDNGYSRLSPIGSTRSVIGKARDAQILLHSEGRPARVGGFRHRCEGGGRPREEILLFALVAHLSLTALMEPPMFGLTEPLTSPGLRVSDGVIISSFPLV